MGNCTVSKRLICFTHFFNHGCKPDAINEMNVLPFSKRLRFSRKNAGCYNESTCCSMCNHHTEQFAHDVN